MQLTTKQKIFYQFFTAFLKPISNFKYFGKKMSLIDFLFPKLWTLKTQSDKCLKRPASENPSTSAMVNVSKNCRNLYRSTFIILIDPC